MREPSKTTTTTMIGETQHATEYAALHSVNTKQTAGGLFYVETCKAYGHDPVELAKQCGEIARLALQSLRDAGLPVVEVKP